MPTGPPHYTLFSEEPPRSSKLKDRWVRSPQRSPRLPASAPEGWHLAQHGNKLGKLLSLSFLGLHWVRLSEVVTLGVQLFAETQHNDLISSPVKPNRVRPCHTLVSLSDGMDGLGQGTHKGGANV